MKINRRAKNGWTSQVENKHESRCDVCGDKLWINPGGGIYCNGRWIECKKHEPGRFTKTK